MRSTHRPDALRPLRAFAQVARLGSVSRAAEALGISQPAVTLQLQALAREHGVSLLERSGRRLVPTPAGEALLALARPLVDGVDGIGAALRDILRAHGAGGLDVCAGTVALKRLMEPAVRGRAGQAGRDLRLRHATGREAIDLLRDGSVALAVGSWIDLPGDVAFTPLLRSPACLVAPVAHPLAGLPRVTLDDLASAAILLPRRRDTTRHLVDLPFARAGIALHPAQETGTWEAAMALVALGQGVTISTRLAVGPRPDPRVAVLPLPEAFPPRCYGIAMRRGRTPGPAAQELIDALVAAASATTGPAAPGDD